MKNFALIFVFLLLIISACEKDDPTEPVNDDPITITSPTNNSSVTDIVTINTSIGSDYTMLRVDFYIDSDSVYTDSNAPFTYQWDTSIYEDNSTHRIQAVAWDEEEAYPSNVVNVTVTREVTNEFGFLSGFGLTNPAMRVASEGSYLYIASGTDGMSVLNISSPTSPVEVFSFTSPGDFKGIDFSDPYLVTAEGDRGIRLFTALDSGSSNSFNTSGLAWNVKIIGNIIYIADNDALQIVSFANGEFTSLSRISITSGVVKDVDAIGSTVYVLDVNGITEYDVSNPGSPDFTRRYSTFTGQCQSISTDGDYVFVGTTEELRMLTNALVSVDNHAQQGGFTGVYAIGSIVFASSGSSAGGAWAFDYSDGSTLEILDQHTTNETSNDITYTDGYVFLAGQTQVSVLSFSH
ncbi:MAG: hypothetical protein GY839_09415 [candidate division Zixibacteria bacterium]|nr:hypothetical protein [candidate division Zixibacteria bacterium]